MREEYSKQSELLRNSLFKRLEKETAEIQVVKAPPGSGKTRLMSMVVSDALKEGLRVAVATQTRTQAVNLVRILAKDRKIPVTLLMKEVDASPFEDEDVDVIDSLKGHPISEPIVVVSTSAKFAYTDVIEPFDVLFVEEAWQLSWSDFLLLTPLAKKFVFIGDPGQISPVVTVDTARWQMSPVAPHMAAPENILKGFKNVVENLPATWRLPRDTAEMIKPFYDFEFGAVAEEGSRRFLPQGNTHDAKAKRLLGLLESGSLSAVTLSTPEKGIPFGQDPELARHTVEMIESILKSKPLVEMDGKKENLSPKEIGIVATHRSMVTELFQALPQSLEGVIVETPERWQGLERRMMFMVHPLSGMLEPSPFDLTTGRLCVMASRHQIGLIIVGRDHIGDTLAESFPVADQAPLQPDSVGKGHALNLNFWETLRERGRVMGWGM